MEGRTKKAVATIGVISLLPVVWTVPGLTMYPLSVIGALCVCVIGIVMVDVDDVDLSDIERSKACSCPSGV